MTATMPTAPLAGEKLLSFAAAARLVPGRGDTAHGHSSASTLFRWATAGAPAADGTRHRLEAVRVGGRWLTSAEAVQRLFARLTAASLPAADAPAPPPAPTPARRARAARAASAEVESLLATA